MRRFRFKTKDCPDACGRAPQHGERKWTLKFPLDDGGELFVEIGSAGRSALLEMLSQEDRGDLMGG